MNSLEQAWDSAPLGGAVLLALTGFTQAALAAALGWRLFGVGVAFLGVAAAFALGARSGNPALEADPAGQAAGLCVALLGLTFIALGAALSVRRRELFGEIDDAELRARIEEEGASP